MEDAKFSTEEFLQQMPWTTPSFCDSRTETLSKSALNKTIHVSFNFSFRGYVENTENANVFGSFFFHRSALKKAAKLARGAWRALETPKPQSCTVQGVFHKQRSEFL